MKYCLAANLVERCFRTVRKSDIHSLNQILSLIVDPCGYLNERHDLQSEQHPRRTGVELYYSLEEESLGVRIMEIFKWHEYLIIDWIMESGIWEDERRERSFVGRDNEQPNRGYLTAGAVTYTP